MSSKLEQYQKLVQQIKEWNASRLDLFEISNPNEALEFHGVMRFYYQDDAAKVSTKCIRVSNTATTRDVLSTLVEKFRPDMKMLSLPSYSLYEVHSNGEERKLNYNEMPLLVQLNWGKDDREGRFLLKKDVDKNIGSHAMNNPQETAEFKRKLSKREKKELKKKEKESKLTGKENESPNKSTANELYTAVPETSFTRSISNPEAVMRRRRQQKLEKKLHDLRNKDDGGGTLKIYGETINPDVPYKTLLLSVNDTAAFVVKETLDKYGLDKEDPDNYCLIEVVLPPGGLEYNNGESSWKEYILEDDECPLAILLQQLPQQGTIMFHLKQRPPDMARKRRKPASVVDMPLRHAANELPPTAQPYLEQLNPDGSLVTRAPKHFIATGVSEVGGHPSSPGRDLQLPSPDIFHLHCTLAYADGVVTITPANPEAELVINGQRIFDTAIVYSGSVIYFGKSFIFRYINPQADLRPRPAPADRTWNSPDRTSRDVSNFETTFDVDGHVATMHEANAQMLGPPRSDRSDLLPATVEFHDRVEDNFLIFTIYDILEDALNFKLTPSYVLYMAVRHRLLTATGPASDRGHQVASLACKMAEMIQQIIDTKRGIAPYLALWMANASELLHFLKRDRDLGRVTMAAQDVLAEAVQDAFSHFVSCMEAELDSAMRAFLDPSGDDLNDEGHGPTANRANRPNIYDVLDVLSSTMTQLRRCRVNAALTIQLFSQLFHFINMWLFNKLVLEPRLYLCTRMWGHLFKRRLGRIEKWAEKQGLELAAECHLARVVQASHLLEAPKSTADDITSISSTCFKLNSLQLGYLLAHYQPSPGEQPIPRQLIDRVVDIARSTADDMTINEGRDIRLDEERDLQLPFLLPEDGYSCDNIKGLPAGLPDFLHAAVDRGLCQFIVNQAASGAWTVYMRSINELEGIDADEADSHPLPPPIVSDPQQAAAAQYGRPEVISMALQKKGNSLGLSIVAAKGDHSEGGIYIKSVVPNGAAYWDQRLAAGDQLLEVDGKSLIGVSQEDAAKMMKMTGDVVMLKVAKEAAIYHGLAQLLMQPSPNSQRANLGQQAPPAPQQQSYGQPAQQQPAINPQRQQQQPAVTPQRQQQQQQPPPPQPSSGSRQPSSKQLQQQQQPPQSQPYGGQRSGTQQQPGYGGQQQPPQTYSQLQQQQQQAPYGQYNQPPQAPYGQQQQQPARPQQQGAYGAPYGGQQQPLQAQYGQPTSVPGGPVDSAGHPLYAQVGARKPSSKSQLTDTQPKDNRSHEHLINAAMTERRMPDSGVPLEKSKSVSNLGYNEPVDAYGRSLHHQQPPQQQQLVNKPYNNRPPEPKHYASQPDLAGMYSGDRGMPPAMQQQNRPVSSYNAPAPGPQQGNYLPPAQSYGNVQQQDNWPPAQPDVRPSKSAYNVREVVDTGANQPPQGRAKSDQTVGAPYGSQYGAPAVDNNHEQSWNQANTFTARDLPLKRPSEQPPPPPQQQQPAYSKPQDTRASQPPTSSYNQPYPALERSYSREPERRVPAVDNTPLPPPPSSAQNWQTESPPPRPPPPAEDYDYNRQQQPVMRQYSQPPPSGHQQQYQPSASQPYQPPASQQSYQPPSQPNAQQPSYLSNVRDDPVSMRESPGRQMPSSEPQYPYMPRPAPASVDLNLPPTASRFAPTPSVDTRYSQPDNNTSRASVISTLSNDSKSKAPPPSVKPKPVVANAWERDQKEKDEKAKEDEMKRAREDEIRWLETKGARTPDDEERLKRLKFDVEFDRRVQEMDAKRNFGTDIESQIERMKMLELMKVDIERRQQQQVPTSTAVKQFDEPARDRGVRHSNSFKQSQDDPVSSEVQMRRDVQPVRTRDMPPERSSGHEYSGASSASNNRMPPPPPERKSSYEPYGVPQTSSYSDPRSAPSSRPVSYFGGADQMLGYVQAPLTPQEEQKLTTQHHISTPGVVGMQEVYRDPRERLLQSKAVAQQMHQHNQQQQPQGPEILSFKDKMKMFGTETGGVVGIVDDERARNSSAQRRIESVLNAH